MAIDPKNRPVRVINDDTTEQELAAGHITPGGDPPKNEDARGGFGNREGREGYGTDTANGITALGENRNADSTTLPPDNMLSDDQGRDRQLNEDMPNPDLLDEEDRIEARRPVDELDADDARTGLDEMENPNSRVGMGQMEQPQPNNDVLARQGTNADLTDPNATDTAIDQ
ncbi:hypothetical protein MTX78_22330 [Hymenobacter tibetensis]|uniref:Uncharacterized protein n=1 Tax=Hymenobacter tibetensis TaxID=497967 RepID=A0ABY4CX36_9BACT|nr:hypothetical protein [Hymenobacter tibetensis]UOG74839.1 hypothetical protein MTX78_22330 [Hymenobacter tibetensis]